MFFTGVHLKASGNIMRNVHPLYYSDYTDYQNSCAFLDESGNNWYDYCYGDQFATAFRTTDWGQNIYNDCYCFWYSPQGDLHTAFRADNQFNATVTNFKAGFGDDCENVVLTVGEKGGSGTIDHIVVQNSTKDNTYKSYVESDAPLTLVLMLFGILMSVIASITTVIFIYIKKKTGMQNNG